MELEKSLGFVVNLIIITSTALSIVAIVKMRNITLNKINQIGHIIGHNIEMIAGRVMMAVRTRLASGENSIRRWAIDPSNRNKLIVGISPVLAVIVGIMTSLIMSFVGTWCVVMTSVPTISAKVIAAIVLSSAPISALLVTKIINNYTAIK